MTPLVSIIIPAYHAHEFLPRALKSVLAQDFNDWEIVLISDDGMDYTAYAERFLPRGRWQQVSTGKIGSGPAHARNTGLAAARGRVIATLDADDEFLPGKLTKMVPRALEYGLCSCLLQYAEYTPTGVVRELTSLRPFPHASGPIGAMIYPLVNFSANSMLVFNRETTQVYWPEELLVMEDLICAMHAFNSHPQIYHCNEELHRYVKRAGSLCNSPDSSQKFIRDKETILHSLQTHALGITSQAARDSLARFIGISLETEKDYERALGAGQDIAFPVMLAKKLASVIPA